MPALLRTLAPRSTSSRLARALDLAVVAALLCVFV